MSQAMQEYTRIISGLHQTWNPHDGQIRVLKDLLNSKTKDVFIQAGRNWGKTELMAYALWRFAQQMPGSENYYFAPYMKQAREIIWATGRLQSFGPKDWVASINETEMRIRFKNGSFIKCDGSDNTEAYRGVKPKGLSVLDEFKDFKRQFYEAYDPNRAAHSSPMLIIGTPPDRDCQFTEVADAYRKNKDKRFYWAPTKENPYITEAWLKSKEEELKLKGDEDIWQREYLALFVKGSKARIFPMLSKDSLLRSQDIKRHSKRSEYIWFADPAGASTFAVLFGVHDPDTKSLTILDEIYEQDQKEMTVARIGARILEKEKEICDEPDRWTRGYDEAETWFSNEFVARFDLGLIPTQKALKNKIHTLSLIKDLLLNGKLKISEKCEKLFWEMDNYYKDDQGNIPKRNDHLIDAARYLVVQLGYDFEETKPINLDELDLDDRYEGRFFSNEPKERDLCKW